MEIFTRNNFSIEARNFWEEVVWKNKKLEDVYTGEGKSLRNLEKKKRDKSENEAFLLKMRGGKSGEREAGGVEKKGDVKVAEVSRLAGRRDSVKVK